MHGLVRKVRMAKKMKKRKRSDAEAKRKEKIMGPWQAGLEHERRQGKRRRVKVNKRKKFVARL